MMHNLRDQKKKKTNKNLRPGVPEGKDKENGMENIVKQKMHGDFSGLKIIKENAKFSAQ